MWVNLCFITNISCGQKFPRSAEMWTGQGQFLSKLLIDKSINISFCS